MSCGLRISAGPGAILEYSWSRHAPEFVFVLYIETSPAFLADTALEQGPKPMSGVFEEFMRTPELAIPRACS